MNRYSAEHVIPASGMDAIAAIEGRASIRKYTQRPVDDNTVSTIINAGFCAPSCMNARHWGFVVVREPVVKKALAEASEYAKMLEYAPVAIAVCGDSSRQDIQKFVFEDCAAAAQNMLLCAHALGLGAVWCGLTEEGAFPTAIRELLKLPEYIIPAMILGVGWPEKPRRRLPRFEQSQVHEEFWRREG